MPWISFRVRCASVFPSCSSVIPLGCSLLHKLDLANPRRPTGPALPRAIRTLPADGRTRRTRRRLAHPHPTSAAMPTSRLHGTKGLTRIGVPSGQLPWRRAHEGPSTRAQGARRTTARARLNIGEVSGARSGRPVLVRSWVALEVAPRSLVEALIGTRPGRPRCPAGIQVP